MGENNEKHRDAKNWVMRGGGLGEHFSGVRAKDSRGREPGGGGVKAHAKINK